MPTGRFQMKFGPQTIPVEERDGARVACCFNRKKHIVSLRRRPPARNPGGVVGSM